MMTNAGLSTRSRRCATALGGVLGGALSLGASVVQAQELQYSTHLPPHILAMTGVQQVFDAVTEATGGAVTAKYFWAGALHSAPENFDAVSEGVIDAAFTQPASNQAQMPINLIFGDLMALGGNPYATAGAINETILLDCPDCQAEYAANDTIFLGAHAGTQANLACRDEIGSIEQLAGLRINGQPAMRDWIDRLGGARVDIPPPRMLEALQRNEVDCVIISPEWLSAFSIVEGTGSLVHVPTGSQFATSLMTMNLQTWEGLSDEARAAFRVAMPEAIAMIEDGYVAADAAALERAEAEGVVMTDLGGTYEAQFADFLTGAADAAVAAAEGRGVSNARAIVDAFLENLEKWNGLIEANGTENYAQLLSDEIFSQLTD